MKKIISICLTIFLAGFSGGSAWCSTEGASNNFFGDFAGFVTSGIDNSFFGGYAGRYTTTGNSNSFFGFYSGFTNTEGVSNSFFGKQAGRNNTTGDNNNFLGRYSGFNNTTGNSNNFFGFNAGYLNSEGIENSFFGHSAGFANTASYNNFFGSGAGYFNTSGNSNSFFGHQTGYFNTTGSSNSFFGRYAGQYNTTGSYNSFFGRLAGQDNTTGLYNSFFGDRTGVSNTTGGSNIYIGAGAGYTNTEGWGNVFLGASAGFSSTVGSYNVFLGDNAGYFEEGSNKLYISNSDTSTPLIYGEFDNEYLEVNGSLHVKRSDGTAQLLVEETSSTTAKRFLLELNNNGAPGFTFLNSDSGDEWQFSQDQNGNFIVSRLGTGGAELKITKSGSVIMGPGSTTNFALAPNGNLTIGGTLIQNSDINTKENLDPVEGQEILALLRELPISTWNLKTDEDNARHLGPMAQDFYAAFGLGSDNRHIAPLDVGGVALVAIQALLKENGELKKRLLNLEQKLNVGTDSI